MHIRLVFNFILSWVGKWRAVTHVIFTTIKSKLMPANFKNNTVNRLDIIAILLKVELKHHNPYICIWLSAIYYNKQKYFQILSFRTLEIQYGYILYLWEGTFGPITLDYPHHFLLKCLYQAIQVSSHVFVCLGERCCPFLRCWYLILELFWQSDILFFPFYKIIIKSLLTIVIRDHSIPDVLVYSCKVAVWQSLYM